VKIIIIEDEQALRREIISFLQEQGYLCEEAATYLEGSEKLALYDYDAVVVDITLPGGSGLTLLQELKQHHPDAAVLIISARDALDDRITGLDLGADDYLVKPFHLAELNARLHALIRRRKFHGADSMTAGDITLETDSKTVMVRERMVRLTRKEFELLLYFMVNKNRVLSKQSIAEHLWGDDYDMADNYDFVYVHINNLRKKLHQAGADDHFKTLYGLGYKFIIS
jgi:DNA-binding response OmpR family regulator